MRHIIRPLLALLLSASVAVAQTPPPVPRHAAATQPELDQMLAPIALYPDSLLSQIFMASTYPLEVVEAARWSRANPDLKGEDAVAAVEQKDWDPSVKSLAAFPQILAMMDQQVEWTARLGDVFIAQEPQVMETVQNLRQKAYEAGNLRSTEQATVVQQGPAYVIEPTSPQVVYVPYYDPRVAYGSWWWPAYPPVYWTPWPGYAYPGYVAGFAWGGGITVGARFFFSSCDWRARRVTIVNVTNVFVTRPGAVIRPVPVRTGQPVVWQHDPAHRRGVPYHIASVEQRFGRSALADQRRDFRWQGPLAATTRNGSLNRPEVHVDHIRQNPRRGDGGHAGRPDGSSGSSARPDFRAPVTPRPPAATAPQAQPRGFANHGQAGNRPGQGTGKAHGEGRR